jgi:hypothetical protein
MVLYMNGQGDKAQGDVVGLIIGLFVSFLLIWVFWQVISQINFWYGILFIFVAVLMIVSALARR